MGAARLRTALTMLSIVIGVTSVIVLQALRKAPDITDLTPLLSGVGTLHKGTNTYSAALVGTDAG
jgi:ABC-type antimicrobial peptide transport system permease subunit